jgi:hypothetical protein
VQARQEEIRGESEVEVLRSEGIEAGA